MGCSPDRAAPQLAGGDRREGEFAPLARIGDMVGARWDNGKVTMPEGYKAAWQSFVDGGWMTLAAPEEHGGQGLGAVELIILMEELGYALAPLPFLSNAAAGLVLQEAGSEEQRERWLPGGLAAVLAALALFGLTRLDGRFL